MVATVQNLRNKIKAENSAESGEKKKQIKAVASGQDQFVKCFCSLMLGETFTAKGKKAVENSGESSEFES